MQNLRRREMASTATGNLISIGNSRSNLLCNSRAVSQTRRHRRVSYEAGRGIEILSHAIEYLADEFSLECMSPRYKQEKGQNPSVAAIEVLKRLNREVYFSCPEIPTLGERLRAFLRLEHS
jgi:hypothetical protein